MFPGVSDYGNYNGFNLRYVPSLRQALLHYGWSQSSAGQWCGSAGQVSLQRLCGRTLLTTGVLGMTSIVLC
jgi:hypothetical protein